MKELFHLFSVAFNQSILFRCEPEGAVQPTLLPGYEVGSTGPLVRDPGPSVSIPVFGCGLHSG